MQNQTQEAKTYEDYTVAVVCALEFEMSAVRNMLEEEHERLPDKPGDQNGYILGQLSGHNTVLAWLPGNQGKSAAATVAANLDRTFPSIAWRFLVGIGGGVPSDKNDIRLGDVVVSMPEGTYGGVVQYDLGKDTDAGFVLKGFLAAPPSRLRSAVQKMQSNHRSKGNGVDEFISTMIRGNWRLDGYKRPAASSDILYNAEYPHPMGQDNCECCDEGQIMERRPLKYDGPVVYYGLIASGDRVMRSALKRGMAVGNIGDILCFEMEAAGLTTAFPYITVRGISDYADSHKNDQWQHYAAAAAAACTKELLSCLGPPEVLESIATRSAPTNKPSDKNSGRNHYVFTGRGIQHVGNGNFNIGRDLRIN